MNQIAQQLPPIVYIHHGNWHIAWCLPGRGVTFRTLRANPAEHCVVRDFTDATGQSQVRAAINGGFFYPIRERRTNDPRQDPFATDPERRVQMIAEVGTGSIGSWEWGIPISRNRGNRYCFGISDRGRIEFRVMRVRHGNWRVHPDIESRYPYGLSNVGLLVRNGQRCTPPPYWPRPLSEARRTALAWTRDGHIFFVTNNDGATWDQTADFIRLTLPNILRGQPYNTRIDPSTISAIMLDGGGSTKFGYRLNPRRSSTYLGFPRVHASTAPNSERYLTTYIIAEATFQE